MMTLVVDTETRNTLKTLANRYGYKDGLMGRACLQEEDADYVQGWYEGYQDWLLSRQP